MDLINYTIRFSSMQDADYINHHRRQAAAHAGDKYAGALMLGTAGLGLGHTLGKGKGALIGGALGAVGGYYLGKKSHQAAKNNAKYHIHRYVTADEKDKSYLRRRRDIEAHEDLERQKIRALQDMSYRR